jgi:hypothetical protein
MPGLGKLRGAARRPGHARCRYGTRDATTPGCTGIARGQQLPVQPGSRTVDGHEAEVRHVHRDPVGQWVASLCECGRRQAQHVLEVRARGTRWHGHGTEAITAVGESEVGTVDDDTLPDHTLDRPWRFLAVEPQRGGPLVDGHALTDQRGRRRRARGRRARRRGGHRRIPPRALVCRDRRACRWRGGVRCRDGGILDIGCPGGFIGPTLGRRHPSAAARPAKLSHDRPPFHGIGELRVEFMQQLAPLRCVHGPYGRAQLVVDQDRGAYRHVDMAT